MKIVGIIFSLLITLISAALFRGFPRGVLSVHHSFGKLMSDVVSNVRQNIDCSIQSMQGILDKGKPTPYTSNSRCNEQANQRVTHTNTIHNVETATSNPIKVNKFTNGGNVMNTKLNLKKDTPRLAVNKTIIDIINKQTTQRKLGEINEVLRNESDHDQELKKIERDYKDPLMEEVIHEIELLREHKQNDSSKFDEVREIAKEVLNVNTNDTTSKVTMSLESEELKQIVTDFERYSNNTLKEIEKQFKDWEVVESNQLSSIKNILQRQQVTSSIQNRTDDKTRSFKGIAKNIFDGKYVYSNHTSGAIIENGAVFMNKSETVKYESIVTSTENRATDNPVSLSMSQVGSNIVNKGELNNLFKILHNEPDSKEIYTISEKSISSHNDSRSDKNSEIIITSTEKSGKLDLSSTEKHVHLQNYLSGDHMNSNLDTGVEIISMNPLDLSDEEKYMRNKNTLSMNKIIQTNDSDNVTESMNMSSNISGILGNVSSVEKYLASKRFNQITPIDIRSMSTNISLNSGYISDVSNGVQLATTESLLFTIQNNLTNDIDATTESYYKSTNIDNVLSNTPYLSRMVNIVNNDNSGFLNKMNSRVNIDRESESTNTSTITNDITDFTRIEQSVTIESIISTDHGDESKTEPIDTIMNTDDDTSTMLSFEKMVTTENYFSTNKINLTEHTDNETESIVTSTTIGNIPDVVTTENKNTTVIINQMYNSIPTSTESIYKSANTYHNLVDKPAVLYAENLVTTENYYIDKIDSNYHSLEKSKSISNISINEDITLDISSVENHMTTANLDDANYMNPNDDSIERTESIETSMSTYNITEFPNLNNLVTTESYIFSKLNSNDNKEPVFMSTSTITDSIPDVISSEYPASATQINSSHNIDKLTETRAISTDTDITSVLTTENTRTNDCSDKKSECIISSTNIDDTSDMSNVGSQMTTEYFIGSNQRNDHIETSTDFSVEYTLINTGDGLTGTKYISSVNRVVTTESPIVSNKLTSTTIQCTDDTPDIISSEKLVLSAQINSNRDIENINESNLTSTNVEDLQHNTLNIQENVTTDNSRIDTNFSNGYFYTGTERISPSSNIDDISNVSNVGSQISTKYQSNVDIETSTDFSTIYISAHTNDGLADGSGVPRTNTQVTTENYFNNIIYTNDDKVEENESIVTSTYISDTLDVSNEENLITTETLVPRNFVDSYNNITEETEPIDTSTNIGDIIKVSSMEESPTLEKPYAMNKMNSNNTVYSNAKFLSTSANTDLLNTLTIISSSTTFSNDEIDKETESFDNISDMFSMDNLETTEYSLTTNEINAYFNTPTETFDVPNINILVTTGNYHFADNIYSDDEIAEDSESTNLLPYTGDILNVSSKENLATTENLISTYHVDSYNYKAKETEYIDTSTNKVDIINLSGDEEFVSSHKPDAMDEIDANNKIYKRSKFISTSPKTELLVTPNRKKNMSTEFSSSQFYSKDDIDQKTESLGDISKKITEEKLESPEDVLTTNQINAELHTSTETVYTSAYTDNVLIDTSDVSSKYIIVTTDNNHYADNIYSNDDTVEDSESMDTSTYYGDIIDVSSAEEVLTSIKPHTTDEINFSNSIYKNAKSIQTPTNTDSLDTLSFEEIVPTKNTSSTVFSNADLENETESIDASAWTRNEFIGTSTRIDDTSIVVSSEENLDTTEEVIPKNHADLYDDIAKENYSIDASTYKVDIVDVTDKKEFLTEKTYTTNDIQSNYDTNEETNSIDSDSGEALDVSNTKKLVTPYPISGKPVNLKINKHTESIDTSTQTNWASSVEQIASTKHILSTKQIITKYDTNTESTDILTDSDDKPDVSNLENYLPVKNNPPKQITNQKSSFVSSSEDLNPKGNAREQAVKLALNIFEQSKRSQMIMKSVFKNEKHARNLF